MDRFSATRPRLWEEHEEGLNRTHSDLVKFSPNDADYEPVFSKIQGIADKATEILALRYLSQGRQRSHSTLLCLLPNNSTSANDETVIESPNTLNADEEACLRSLSFTEIYARESTIETAIQNTGSWLLESQDFQDWFQRKRLDEHQGFFWIQGNPGSGKSTLMKKVYSHALACPQDPSSVIAAFFFNARGDEIEKSPTGLFRTLLHALCQHISTLRDLVVKAYVAKRRLLGSDWKWQISELKKFLAAVVTSSTLGQRSLLLFVDALDECDLAATQSVIHIFEELANSSRSEGTRFSICLSNRYWPQFKVKHCFIARVELENEDDIVKYIENGLQSTQTNEDLDLHAALRTEILDKARGTFLWVILVVRDLLQANTAGATLRELRDIVQRVPEDLSKFYQHQIRSTESKDRERMLRLLQLVFYAQRPLNPTELRYALAFGCGAYASYAEWSQSSEYVNNDEQMEKRIREDSKGLIEIAQLPWDKEHPQDPDDGYPQDPKMSRRAVVQFIHQSARDFLSTDGFAFLRDSRWRTQSAEGHEFIKTACLNYLLVKDLEAISVLDWEVSDQFCGRHPQMPNLKADHPLLHYVVLYIFPHAAEAEKHGIAQDGFRTYMCGNIQGCFESWRYFHDMLITRWDENRQGPDARPIHVLAQYGLLTKDIVKRERNINIRGGAFRSALVAACWRGHQDAVRILLQFGANPKFDGSRSGLSNLISHPWKSSIAPLSCAVYNQDLTVLRQLLNAQQPIFTLRERLRSSIYIQNEKPHLDSFLALLFPEATFPDSAIEDLCEAFERSTIRVFSFLLGKCNESVLHEETLWHGVFPSRFWRISKIRALLDRGGRIEINEDVVLRMHGDDESAGEVLSLLLDQHCEIDMTEDLVDAMSEFEDSSQIIRAFEAVGYHFEAFTSEQLLRALQRGSAETAAFFLQRHDSNTSAAAMLEAALSNEESGEEVTCLLLGHLNPDHIDEKAINAALANERCGNNLFELLHSRWNSLKFSEATLAIAVREHRPNDIKIILENYECVTITEEILTAATVSEGASGHWAADVVDLLLLHDPYIFVPESTVIGAIRNRNKGISILDEFKRHGKLLFCTDSIVEAAARSDQGPDALEIILHQCPCAKISSSMIMTAMRAKTGAGAALISVMLKHDHTLVVDEEHLIAAASNPYSPSTIFAFLQSKGKLGDTNPSSETLDVRPAKRRRLTHNPPPRISTDVIDAASSNPNEAARLRLLELFVKWGVITATDLEERMSENRSRSNSPSTSEHSSQLSSTPENDGDSGPWRPNEVSLSLRAPPNLHQ